MRSSGVRAALAAALLVLAIAAAGLWWVAGRGFSTLDQPSALEAFIAGRMRGLATPTAARSAVNPVAISDATLADGMAHFADHCANCHANDGSGNTPIGKGLYPKPPDMRQPGTQNLTDGELFYIIENGVMLTGMPGWSTGTIEGERASWELVHFIRRLPTLTSDDLAEMEKFNPVSRQQIEEERQIEDFLKGGDPPAPAADPHAGHAKQ